MPKVKFPDSFSLSVNEKHFSNTNESLKLIEDIITPYVEKERGKLGLSDNQPALVIFDVFSEQMTDPVMQKLKKIHQGGKSTCQYDQPFSTTKAQKMNSSGPFALPSYSYKNEFCIVFARTLLDINMT